MNPSEFQPHPKEMKTMPTLPITTEACTRAAAQLQLQKGDIVVCSYPKSGTTWTQNIVATLVTASEGLDLDAWTHIQEVAPFFDIDRHWDLTSGEPAEALKEQWKPIGRRVWNSHFRWDMMPKAPSNHGKFLYLVRSSADVACSFYHHLKNQKGDAGSYEGDFDAFVEDFMKGTLPYGKWSDHIKSWCSKEAAEDGRVLFLSYEELKKDLKGSVLKIVEHLNLSLSEEQVDQILPRFSFQYMREHPQKYQPISVEWKEGYHFIRKGQVGDGKASMSAELASKYDQWVQEEFPEGLPSGIFA